MKLEGNDQAFFVTLSEAEELEPKDSGMGAIASPIIPDFALNDAEIMLSPQNEPCSLQPLDDSLLQHLYGASDSNMNGLLCDVNLILYD